MLYLEQTQDMINQVHLLKNIWGSNCRRIVCLNNSNYLNQLLMYQKILKTLTSHLHGIQRHD